MRELPRHVVARNLRMAALALPVVRLIGAWLWLSGFDGAGGGEKLSYVMASMPMVIALSALLYVVAVLLGRPDPVRPQAPAALDPVVVASVLDLDAPIDHVVFQPATPPRMTEIPIGDPHAAFRRD